MEERIKKADSMKHIYIINNSNSPAFGYGVGTYVTQLLKCMEGNEMNLTVINLDSLRDKFEISEDNRIRTIQIPFHHSSLIKKTSARALKYISYLLTYYINSNEKNIFHFNFIEQGELAKRLKSQYPDCKIILTIHYLSWLMETKGSLTKLQTIINKEKKSRNYTEQAIYQEYDENLDFIENADKIICLSKYTKALFCQQLGVDSNKIELIYNGLEDNSIHFSEQERSFLRSQYLLSDCEKVILFVGRVDKLKGIEYLMEAFRLTLKSISNARLIIVGDGDYKLCLEKSPDIWTKVTFTGKIPKEKLIQFYQLADVGVLPSFCEQCSYTAIEMMMNNLPFIGTSSTGLKEMLDNRPEDIIPLTEEAGEVLFPVDKLAGRLIKHLSHPQKTGKSMYENRYSLKKMRIKINRLYSTL